MDIKTTKISAVSRIAFKNKHDNWFTVEFAEERQITGEYTEEELVAAREELWDTVNGEVDVQVDQVLKA